MPTNLLDWPRVSGLLPEIKLILGMGFWAGRYTNSIGIAEIPLRALAATLGLDPAALETGIKTLCGEKLLVGDFDRFEFFIADWFRFHTFRGPGTQIAKREFLKISSSALGNAVLKAAPWLEPDRTQPRQESQSLLKQEHYPPTATAAANPTSSAAEKIRIRRPSGIVTFTPTDPERATQLELMYQTAQITNAIKVVEEQNKEPVPGLVQKEIERQIAAANRKATRISEAQKQKQQAESVGDAKAGIASALAALGRIPQQGASMPKFSPHSNK